MRLFTVLLVASLTLLLGGISFAADDVPGQSAIDAAIQGGAAVDMTVTLMNSGLSTEVAVTRMMNSGADAKEVEQGINEYRKHHHRKHHHRHHDGDGDGNCVSGG